VAERMGFPEKSCVVVLRGEEYSGSLLRVIRDLAPMEARDLLAEDGAGSALLIKEGDDPAEIAEFAMALVDTVEGETGLRLRAGVSDLHAAPEEWPQAYREAISALDIGERGPQGGRVFVYGDQVLERVMEALPETEKKRLKKQYLGESGHLDAETLETAQAFFDADLNLSVAARQMFVHRNTLTYRLDKIRKDTGLDLRVFRDAVIFRMLMTLPEEEDEKK